MKRLDQITGALLFAGSLYYTFEASKMPLVAGKAPGAGWMPLGVGLIMGLLSILLFLSGTRRSAATDTPVVWPTGRGLVNNLAILVGLATSVAMLQVAGYLVTTFAFLFALTLILGRYDWKLCLVAATVCTAALYWVFKVWLAIPLPAGVIKIM